MSEISPQLRTCSRCYRTLEITHFRRRQRGQEARHSWCDVCAQQHSREQRARQRNQDVTGLFRGLVRRHVSPKQQSKLIEGLIQRLGGVNRFAQELLRYAADDDHPRRQLRAVQVMGRLIELQERREPEREFHLKQLKDGNLRDQDLIAARVAGVSEAEILDAFTEFIKEMIGWGALSIALRRLYASGELSQEFFEYCVQV